jgi:signal transduction histidine kinase
MEKKKILIVEDEYIIAMEVRSNLKSMGYEVTSIVDTGEGAIAKVEKDEPDLVLMDIQLKGKMDGIEAAKHIRAKVDIPIVFLSAFAEEEKIKRAKLTLPYGYLLKPVQNRDLRVTIEMAFYASEINFKRTKAEKGLQKAYDVLEHRVEERTIELKEAKEKAESADRIKTEFLANISHEFRTPMHQILSFSKFGVDKTNKVTREKLHHYFLKIGSIGNNLLSLLNDLLDLSKIESDQMDYDMIEVDLQLIVNNIIENFNSWAVEKELTLNLETSTSSVKAVCDEFKIRQVIRNLLSNAIKFTPSGKIITISISLNNLNRNENFSIPAILISIKDEGVGIPQDELETVFDKFIQSSKTKTGAGGTGLGLAICKEIIKAHSGKIWAENNPEGGATFSFMLPYEQEAN